MCRLSWRLLQAYYQHLPQAAPSALPPWHELTHLARRARCHRHSSRGRPLALLRPATGRCAHPATPQQPQANRRTRSPQHQTPAVHWRVTGNL